jgi:hypothetical protein
MAAKTTRIWKFVRSITSFTADRTPQQLNGIEINAIDEPAKSNDTDCINQTFVGGKRNNQKSQVFDLRGQRQMSFDE